MAWNGSSFDLLAAMGDDTIGTMTDTAAIKINLATPCYGDSFSGAYVASLYKLIYAGMNRGLTVGHTAVDYADIVASRNYLLTNFYYGKLDCSHILFVDDDMGFAPDLIFDMLSLREDVVGAFCPARRLDLKALHAEGDQPFGDALRAAQRFVGSPHPSGQSRGGFQRAARLGTGIMLISRRAVDRMVRTMPDIERPPSACQMPYPMPHPKFLTPFDKVEVADRPLSEDYSFCWRWTELCGGTLWAATHHRITHTGRFTFEGMYGTPQPPTPR